MSCTRQGSLLGLPRFATLILLLITFAVPEALADDQGWVLTQHSIQLGDQYVYISANGLKLINPTAGIAMVTHAPEWRITLYNDQTKVYYETTLAKWKADMESRGLSGNALSGPWTKASNGSIAGTKATEYTTGPKTSTYKNAQGKKMTSTLNGASYWVAQDIKVPPALADMMAAAYGLPTSPSVPLRLNIVDGKGKAKSMLETFRTQTAPIPVSYFACPNGYKLVSSDAEVMVDNDTRQILQDMSKESGLSPSQAAPATTGGVTSGATSTTLPNGYKVSKDDISRFLDALKKTK